MEEKILITTNNYITYTDLIAKINYIKLIKVYDDQNFQGIIMYDGSYNDWYWYKESNIVSREQYNTLNALLQALNLRFKNLNVKVFFK